MYTFAGSAALANSGGNSTSVTLNIGPVNSYNVIAITGNGIALPELNVAGQPLGLVCADQNGAGAQTALFAGLTTGISGSQVITFSSNTIAFVTIGFAVWYVTPIYSGQTLIIPATHSSGTIQASQNQYMFGMAVASGTVTTVLNLSDSTQSLNVNFISGYTGIGLQAAAFDCVVASTGTFTLSNAAVGGNIYASASVFSGPPPRSFSTIFM